MPPTELVALLQDGLVVSTDAIDYYYFLLFFLIVLFVDDSSWIVSFTGCVATIVSHPADTIKVS